MTTPPLATNIYVKTLSFGIPSGLGVYLASKLLYSEPKNYFKKTELKKLFILNGIYSLTLGLLFDYNKTTQYILFGSSILYGIIAINPYKLKYFIIPGILSKIYVARDWYDNPSFKSAQDICSFTDIIWGISFVMAFDNINSNQKYT